MQRNNIWNYWNKKFLIRNLEKYKDFDLDLSENKKNENKKRSGCFEEVSKNFEEHLKKKNNEL